jgi:GntR family transcriptional repressor for pyruvate dehydrogenase complex
MDVNTKIVKKKVADFILEEIRRMIISGELKEGDKLPKQNDFAARLGVSRPSLREALQVLTRLGAIEQRPGLGTVLVARSPALLSGSLDFPFISDGQATLELVEARRVIEVGLVGLAAQRASEEELAAIGESLAEMEAAAEAGQVEIYRDKDLMNHHRIAAASHNRFLITLFQIIRQAVEQFLKEAFSVMPYMLSQSLTDHRLIYNALRARDSKKAGEAMAAHIVTVEKAMESYYRELGQEVDRRVQDPAR